ncbi:MAG TPA: trypsin-like peptidase domain-containing protein [Ktedonobacteraceae bacterium]
MQCTQKPPAYKRRFYTSPRPLCILGLVCVYLLGLAAFVPQVAAAALSAPGGNVSDAVVRQVDIARPAVVRIITTLTGQLSVNFTATVTATFPQNGGFYTLEMAGSGAFVSAHGDILTADHVVNPPHGQDLDNDLYVHAAQDVADYINAHFQVTAPYTASDAYNLLASGSLQSTSTYGQPNSTVFLSTSYVGAINASKLDTVPGAGKAVVDRIEAQSSFNQNDVAVIHVSGMDNMPSIQLSDSSKVAEQDNLTIIGYPGLADLSQTPTNLLTSSINRVYVSALKTTDTGASVLQVGGNIEHGDSGGPALDSNGNIVGIVSFGFSGVNGDYGETSFLQASNSALSLLKTQGINTTPGAFETAWAQAIDDYASLSSDHWQKAANELQSLAQNYPNFQAVTVYLAYAQSQARNGQNPSSFSGGSANILWIVLIILLLLALLGGLFFLMFRRRAQPVVVAPVGVQYTSGVYNPYQSPSGVYRAVPMGYSAGVPYIQPSHDPTSGVQQAVPSGVALPNYMAPAAYGVLPGQIPQTPPIMPGANAPFWPATFPAQSASFMPLPVQTPQPAANEVIPQTPSNWASPEARAESEAAVLPEAAEENGIYTLPDEQAKAVDAWAPAASPAHTGLPASDNWPTLAMEEQAGSAEEKTVVASPQERSFVVPRRPIVPEIGAPEAAGMAPVASPANPFTRIAPCGHANTPDVSFCRICGQPVASNTSETSNGNVS